MIREIILDTETTGFNQDKGDRMIEIALLEVVDDKLTGRQFQSFLNPQGKKSDQGAYDTHLISDDFLKNQPLFKDVAEEILTFIGQDKVVAHNVGFDLRFLNMELTRLGKRSIPLTMGICTRNMSKLLLKRYRWPSLDELCDLYKIDRKSRDKGHGALVDCKLLYQVYCKLRGKPIQMETPQSLPEEEEDLSDCESDSTGQLEIINFVPKSQKEESEPGAVEVVQKPGKRLAEDSSLFNDQNKKSKQ